MWYMIYDIIYIYMYMADVLIKSLRREARDKGEWEKMNEDQLFLSANEWRSNEELVSEEV